MVRIGSLLAQSRTLPPSVRVFATFASRFARFTTALVYSLLCHVASFYWVIFVAKISLEPSATKIRTIFRSKYAEQVLCWHCKVGVLPGAGGVLRDLQTKKGASRVRILAGTFSLFFFCGSVCRRRPVFCSHDCWCTTHSRKGRFVAQNEAVSIAMVC